MSAKTGQKKWVPVIRGIVTSIIMMAIVVIIMLWLMGVFESKVSTLPAAPAAGRPVGDATLQAVERIQVPVTESAVGTVRPVHEAAVASKLLAKVVGVHIKAGQAVSKDMLLVELDDTELKARREQASAAVQAAVAARDQAKTDFDRIQELAKQGAAPKIEVTNATTALQAAEANLNRAKQSLKEAETVLDYAVIKSPLDGIVVDKRVEVGDMVSPGQVLATLYNPEQMQLVARVRESLAHKLDIGQQIPVNVEALNLQCYGMISELVPEAQADSRSFSVKVTGPCPPGVYAGMFGRLTIPLGETDVLVIPQGAIRRVGQLDIVEVASEGRLYRRAVQLGRTYGERVQILSGLQEGEQVAVITPTTQQAMGSL